MHAARSRREFLDEVVRTAQAFPNLVGSSVGALGRRFELAFVSQAVTQPAAKPPSAIEDPASASTPTDTETSAAAGRTAWPS